MKLYFERRIIMEGVNKALTVVKMVGGLVISIGVGAVATNLIRATTPEDVKKVTKICIGVGSFFVAGMTASAASNKFEGTMDSIIKAVQVFTEEDNKSEEEVTGVEA
ncbi:MAG: hypothetical protein WDA37_12640 [Dysgonamonadaceae bacterium]|jgi:hypothetical protein